MGTNLGQLLTKTQRTISLSDLVHQPIGMAILPWLRAFVNQIKVPTGARQGEMFVDERGNMTSHLIGLLNLCVRLLSNRLSPVFIFGTTSLDDQNSGTLPSNHKLMENQSIITPHILNDTFTLLDCFGIPYLKTRRNVDAHGAWMTVTGDLWAYVSTGEALLYGAERVIRPFAVGLAQTEKSRNKKKADLYLVDRRELLTKLDISQEQLVLLGLLTGTSSNPGIRGLSPRRALEVVKDYPTVDVLQDYLSHPNVKICGIPVNVTDAFPIPLNELFTGFTTPHVNTSYKLTFGTPDSVKIIQFLCEKRSFQKEYVNKRLQKLKSPFQTQLQTFFT